MSGEPASVSGMGRTPIGPPIGVFLSVDVDLALRAIAEPFGQRRRSAVIRVAIRRLLANQDGLEAAVRLREENRATRPLFDAVVNMHLDKPTKTELDGLAARHGTTRAEIMRIAVDRFLLELAKLRLAGTPFDIETAVNSEIFNGTANRDRLIARRQRHEAARQAMS
ncbi:hypothetical protein GS676_24340 [Rhodococcus hoagii]|nr:hypothetical protein [Prescottella equi]